ncbi:ClpXP protease specificity-enhancing factor [Salinivibrio sp. IB868]|uniref:ClpXP protease specificity-enhancing factor n=1 Tax=unclassified Salinivibrio TaxID=2636825 RepID=UPI000986D366|nr:MULTISPECIES: ClpXP protease specificity-enhancing factor [unclassified Salinivibrio]OOE66828.1 ClpXP protease specificity-enhancing factor [Salinivibrio sp. IB868]OOE75700.1 ClpXP protease specificity-enhancing factor [Salinivibrio sp. IB870]
MSTSEFAMTPRRPYLVRAFYDWLLDNDLTPHMVVDATLPGVQVPFDYVKDGQIVLNIAPRAVGNLELSNEHVCFNARFGGKPQQVLVPMAAVLAIYARENGAGTMFDMEPAYAHADDEEMFEQTAPSSEGEDDDEPSLVSVDSVDDPEALPQADDEDDTPATPSKKGKPTLTVVK